MLQVGKELQRLHTIARELLACEDVDFQYNDAAEDIIKKHSGGNHPELLAKIGIATINTLDESEAYRLGEIVLEGLNKYGNLEAITDLLKEVLKNEYFNKTSSNLALDDTLSNTEKINGFRIVFEGSLSSIVENRNKRANQALDDVAENAIREIAEDTTLQYYVRQDSVRALGKIYSVASQEALVAIFEGLLDSSPPSDALELMEHYSLIEDTSKSLVKQRGKGPLDEKFKERLSQCYQKASEISSIEWKLTGQRSLREHFETLWPGIPTTQPSVSPIEIINEYIESPSSNIKNLALTALTTEEGRDYFLQQLRDSSKLAAIFLIDFETIARMTKDKHYLTPLYKQASKRARYEDPLDREFCINASAIHSTSLNFYVARLGMTEVLRYLQRPNTPENLDKKYLLLETLFGSLLGGTENYYEVGSTSRIKIPNFLCTLFNQRTKTSLNYLNEILEQIRLMEPFEHPMAHALRFYRESLDIPGLVDSASKDPEKFKDLYYLLLNPNTKLDLFVDHCELKLSLLATLRNSPEGVDLKIAQKCIKYADALEKADNLGIKAPFRFSLDNFIKLIEDRETIGLTDPRKLAVIFAPDRYADHNGAFVSTNELVSDLFKHGYKVLYFEPGSSNPLKEIENIKQRYSLQVDCLVLAGHGGLKPAPSMLLLDPRKPKPRIVGQQMYFYSGLRDYAPVVVIKACSMGWGANNSFLNAAENTLASNGIVIASMGVAPGFTELVYDEQNNITGAKPSSSGQSVYVTDKDRRRPPSRESRLLGAFFGNGETEN